MTFTREAVHCDRCSSFNVDTVTFEQVEGTEVAVLYSDTCKDCGSTGDFANLNPAILLGAKHRSEAKEIQAISTELAKTRSHAAYIARVLEISQATMNGWLAGDGGHTPADLTLLRMLRTYPWLLRVADAGYARNSTDVIVLEQAAAILQKAQEVVKAVEEKIK